MIKEEPIKLVQYLRGKESYEPIMVHQPVRHKRLEPTILFAIIRADFTINRQHL